MSEAVAEAGPGAAEAAAPADAYARRLATRRAELAREVGIERRLSSARLGIFGLGLVLGWLAFGLDLIHGGWLLLPLAVFAALAVWHERVIRRRDRARRAASYYARRLSYLRPEAVPEDVEPGEVDTGADVLATHPHHPYAADLDLFGPDSLYERVCTARTRAGAARLADWLLAPAPPDEIRARQTAIAELRDRLDLREDLVLAGEALRARLHPELLADWGREAPLHGVATWRWIAGVLAVLALAALGAWIFTPAGPLPLVAVGAVELMVGLRFRGRLARVLRQVDQPARELALLASLLERIEAERFAAPRLVALREALETEGAPASREVARLRRLVELADARRNQLFAPLAALLLWGTQFGLAIEAWRQRAGGRVAVWLEAVGELEALLALAGHAFEEPDHVMPELVAGEPRFEAEGLGHPLLAADRCVRNDLRLGDALRVLVVSGSNMSGKSTLLRTVGINAVLAQAGAPVRARRCRLTPLAVGASIRVNDSLQEGASRFYAEILRLRQIVELADEATHPLFLLDEILGGTNSHDRRVGAAAVVRGLVDKGAVGLVTTHDLALARIADEMGERAANVHFEDHLEDGRIAFDFRLREGVVTRSNALALMREVGLEV